MNNQSNKRNFSYSFGLLIIFSLLFTSCASEGQVMYQTQFRNQLSFNKWDLNANGSLSKDEFHSGIHKTLNSNGNRYINEDEWKEAYYYFSTYTSNNYGDFKKWDADHDKRLSNNEFSQCFATSRLYNSWDMDGDETLNKGELFTGLFDTWDINDDATLSSYEVESWQEAAL